MGISRTRLPRGKHQRRPFFRGKYWQQPGPLSEMCRAGFPTRGNAWYQIPAL